MPSTAFHPGFGTKFFTQCEVDMNENLVVYSSKTGFTQRYAEWIAEELSCEAIPLSELDSGQVRATKTIVYGGPVHAGWVVGLKKFLSRSDRQKDQNVFVFAVGLTPINSAEVQRYRTANLSEGNRKIPWFYFQGGVDIDKVKGPVKLVLKMIVLADADNQKNEAKKAGKVIDETINPLKQDQSNRESIKPLVDAVKSIE